MKSTVKMALAVAVLLCSNQVFAKAACQMMVDKGITAVTKYEKQKSPKTLGKVSNGVGAN